MTDSSVNAPDSKKSVSSDYVVLARKWRPYRFDDLAGQAHAARALRNALTSSRVPHALVFTGIRGVGKTTLARLMAMCLNCETGITDTPCGTCNSCKETISGSHPDVMEIDAASRTKVDQMREVLEMVGLAPAVSRYRVIILDEVHMLTTQSFNALLKTLEEPPAHVVFMFATTESRKIPATIFSRCQRYDLRRISRSVMSDHLNKILTAEKVSVEPEGLSAIVRAADGSMRDALSLLDQAIAHGQGSIENEAVRQLLGLTDRQAVMDLMEKILTNDGEGVLEASGHFYHQGVEPLILVGELLDAVHMATRNRIAPGDADADKVDELARLAEMTKPVSLEHLQMIYQTLLRGRQDLQLTDLPLQTLEMLLLRVALLRPIPALESLVKKLQKGSPSGGGAAPAAGAAQGGSAGASNASDGQRVSGSAVRGQTFSEHQKTAQQPPKPAPSQVKVHSVSEKINELNIENSTPTQEPATEERSENTDELTSWDQLISLAEQKGIGLGLKLKNQLVCLSFSSDDQAVAMKLRLIDDCFGPPDSIVKRVREMLIRFGFTPGRIVVEAASKGARPETIQERENRKDNVVRLGLEEQVLAHPMVDKLVERFQGELLHVEKSK
ncbi:MAG: DNA polymerase III subunit gamma/tau [Magnetococcales bacterium]|nr:DNA polymerase III subunit gamma/tau [Magnetococcales bacterium]